MRSPIFLQKGDTLASLSHFPTPPKTSISEPFFLTLGTKESGLPLKIRLKSKNERIVFEASISGANMLVFRGVSILLHFSKGDFSKRKGSSSHQPSIFRCDFLPSGRVTNSLHEFLSILKKKGIKGYQQIPPRKHNVELSPLKISPILSKSSEIEAANYFPSPQPKDHLGKWNNNSPILEHLK